MASTLRQKTLFPHQKTLYDLPKKIFQYCLRHRLYAPFHQHHRNTIRKILSTASRKFTVYLIWSCTNIVTGLLNENLWSVPMETLKAELHSLNYDLTKPATVQLYSIIKFIGQFTKRHQQFIECLQLVTLISDCNTTIPDCCLDPTDVLHLISFNANFNIQPYPKYQSNRLTDFYSTGIPAKSTYVKQYRTCRAEVATDILTNNITDGAAQLYYLESAYYTNSTTDMPPIINRLLRDLNKESTTLPPWPVRYTYNEFNLISTIDSVTAKRLKLLHRTSVDSVDTNWIEMLHIVKEALTVTDEHFVNQTHYYDIYRTNLFQKLYTLGFIDKSSTFSNEVIQLAKTAGIDWMCRVIRCS